MFLVCCVEKYFIFFRWYCVYFRARDQNASAVPFCHHRTKFYNNLPRIYALVELAAYRIVVNYLNNDPLIFDKRVVNHKSGATAYKGKFGLDSFRFDHPGPRLIHDAFEVFQEFGSSKELAGNTMRVEFIEGTEKAAQPDSLFTRTSAEETTAQ